MKEKNNNHWKYFNPKFEYEEDYNDNKRSWEGHKFFAYDLVRNLKPERVIELGTFKGRSFFSFCQAVSDSKLKTDLTAVDTWEGDKHTGFYGDDIYQGVKGISSKYFKSLKTQLLRMTFDEALSKVKEKSIDMLHIDGRHTYRDAKHDFDTWLPKMKDNGIILIHDIVVKRDDFGVYKLWNKLKKKYNTEEFHHTNGLGIVILGDNPLSELLSKKDRWEKYYSLQADNCLLKHQVGEERLEKRKVLNMFKGKAKEREKWIRHLEEDVIKLNKEIKKKNKK